MTTLQVAVVGSGPAGIYTAEALIKQAAKLDPPAAVQVDVLDRLPTPYGLVRYGVAPDHPSIRSIAAATPQPTIAIVSGPQRSMSRAVSSRAARACSLEPDSAASL